MVFTASYLSDLARVRLEFSDLSDFPINRIQIQRNDDPNETTWKLVRGAGGVIVGVESGVRFTGAGGSNAASGDNPEYDILGDIDLRADASLDDWFAPSTQSLVAKDTLIGNQRSYGMFVNSGLVQIRWSTDGTALNSTLVSSTETIPGFDRLAVRATLDVDDGAGNNVATFYTGPSVEGPWTQLGDPVVTPGVTSIFNSTSQMEIGSVNQGSAFLVTGVVHHVQVYDGIDGTLVADPDFTQQPEGTTLFFDSTVHQWQLNGTASIVQIQDGQVDDYEFFFDIENFYRIIPVDPPAGLRLSGSFGDYASTPDDASLDLTSDVDMAIDVTTDFTWDGTAYLFSKWGEATNSRQYALRMTAGGTVTFVYSTTGADEVAISATELVPATPAPRRFALRVIFDADNEDGGNTTTFFIASSLEGAWTRLGEPVVNAGTATIFVSGAVLEVGARDDGQADSFAGTIHAAELLDGINGTPVANPNFDEQPTGTTSFTDDAGKLWTVQGNSFIINEVLASTSITPLSQGDTWLKSIQWPLLNRNIGVPFYEIIQRASRAGVFNVKGRSLPIATDDIRASRQFTITIARNTPELREDFDLVLAAGGNNFVQTPDEDTSGCGVFAGVPGGYVNIAITTERHTVPGSRVFVFILPMRVIAPPVESVVGTTIVWNTVWRLYDDWNELWAENATWNDLWARVGLPEDLEFP